CRAWTPATGPAGSCRRAGWKAWTAERRSPAPLHRRPPPGGLFRIRPGRAAARRARHGHGRRSSTGFDTRTEGIPMQASLLTNLLLPLALGVIMLGLGMGLTTGDFRRVARYPKAVLVGLGLQTLVLTWVAFGLALGFGLRPELVVGLMLLAAS